MNTVTTGDPGYDALMAWINEGGKLTSVSAVAALAAALRFVVIPAILFLAARYGKALNGQRQIMAIHAAGVLMAVLVDFVTHSTVTISQAAVLGFVASNTAIGFHQSTKNASLVSAPAQADDDGDPAADTTGPTMDDKHTVAANNGDVVFQSALAEAAS